MKVKFIAEYDVPVLGYDAKMVKTGDIVELSEYLGNKAIACGQYVSVDQQTTVKKTVKKKASGAKG